MTDKQHEKLQIHMSRKQLCTRMIKGDFTFHICLTHLQWPKRTTSGENGTEAKSNWKPQDKGKAILGWSQLEWASMTAYTQKTLALCRDSPAIWNVTACTIAFLGGLVGVLLCVWSCLLFFGFVVFVWKFLFFFLLIKKADLLLRKRHKTGFVCLFRLILKLEAHV